MDDPTFEITSIRSIRKGVRVLTVSVDDKPIFTDEIKITSAKARTEFVKRLCKDNPVFKEKEILEYLEGLASAAARTETPNRNPPSPIDIPYQITDTGLVYLKPTREGPFPVPLTNFSARIVADIRLDDGAEIVHSFEIEAKLKGRTFAFSIPANQYPSMNWVLEKLGPRAIIYAGSSLKDHTRVAIQQLSDEIQTRVVFVHSGWRNIEGQGLYYLHAGGAIGPEGPEIPIYTQLPPELSRLSLPDPPKQDLDEALRAAFDLLDLGPEHILYPLFAAVFRAVLGNTDFSVHLAGPTGVYKTEFAALLQSFFGASFDARHIPGSWSSTENALEELAFLAKDALLVIDDFAPRGSSHEVQKYHKKADRIFRAQGNRSGRGRLRKDGSLKVSKPPRGLILSTGEDIPSGHSLQARILVLELSDGDVTSEKLSICQEAARKGAYAQVIAGFLKWVAGRYEVLQARLKRRLPDLRGQATREGQHRRIPTIIAELQAGIEIFLEFACEQGVLSSSDEQFFLDRFWSALGKAADAQALHQKGSEPTALFFQFLRSAIASGEAHVADLKGEAPEKEGPEALGWRGGKSRPGGFHDQEWKPLGSRVGWIDGEDLYLDPSASYKAAKRMGSDTDRIPVGQKTLMKRLRENGHLLSWDEQRTKNTVRIFLQGTRRIVLHLRASMVIFRAQRAQQALASVTEDKTVDYDCSSRVRIEDTPPITDPNSESRSPSIENRYEIDGPEGPQGPVSIPYTSETTEKIHCPQILREDSEEDTP